jgi:hypothetical protein
MKPPPFIIDKEGVRLIFNEPHDKGLSKVLWYAGNRLAQSTGDA